MTDVRSRTHAQAVDAAIELFTRKGYEQTTVEEIADAAQVSRATFFRRYGSKEDVVFADHELLLDEVVVMLAATRPVPDAEGRLTPSPASTRTSRSAARRGSCSTTTSGSARRRSRGGSSSSRCPRCATASSSRPTATSAPSPHTCATRSRRTSVGRPRPSRSPRRSSPCTTRSCAGGCALPTRTCAPRLEEAFADLRRAAVGRYAASDDTAATQPREPGDGLPGRRVVVTVVDAGTDAQGVADDVARAVRDALA